MEKKYVCSRCKENHTSDDIRLTADSKIVCLYCLGQKTREIITQVPKEKTIINESSVEYECKNCGYKFKRKQSVEFKLCPYCGKEGKVVTLKSKNASNLIKESLDKRFDN